MHHEQTADPICRMMAQMSLPKEQTDLDGRRSVNDPACGSGRMLLASAEIQPNWHFVGQDVDVRCVRMTAINLALRNHYGHVVWGNTLTNTCDLIYETGRVQVWGNAIRKVNRVPIPDHASDPVDVEECHHESSGLKEKKSENDANDNQGPTSQLQLF